MKIFLLLLITTFLFAEVDYSKMSIEELLDLRDKIAIKDAKPLVEELNKRIGEMSEEQFLDFANNTIGVVKCDACKNIK